MRESKEPQPPTILLLLDVLGFGSIYRRLGHEATLSLYHALVAFVQAQEGSLDMVPLPDGRVAVGWFLPEHAYFSDTILFWTTYDPIRLFRLTALAAEAVCKAVEVGLPVRGAITIGEGTFDNRGRIYMGTPMFEAAETEKAQRWIGVSFGPSILGPPFREGLYLHTVLAYKSHAKPRAGTAVPGLVVDWPRRWRETRPADLRQALDDLDVDKKHAPYYKNTLRFAEFSEANHDWFRRSAHLDFG
jgi:hypothetical protein